MFFKQNLIFYFQQCLTLYGYMTLYLLMFSILVNIPVTIIIFILYHHYNHYLCMWQHAWSIFLFLPTFTFKGCICLTIQYHIFK